MKIIMAEDFNFTEYAKLRKSDERKYDSTVLEIIDNVKKRGDAALLEYTEKFDGVALESFRVTKKETEQALSTVGKDLLKVFEEATENITFFHKNQKRKGFRIEKEKGVFMGQRIIPLQTVGIYSPGGTAAYPSSLIMNVVPAKIAGVDRVFILTPPDKKGSVNAGILAAAHILGIDEIYKVGGAQAIAAMAYGTETIPMADKIVGPGNIYVATAKRMVYGVVDIDMIAGPSDVLIIADETAVSEYVAVDLLAQAEHDENSASILITTSQKLATEVKNIVEELLSGSKREEIASKSIEENGMIIIVDNIDDAVVLSNKIAPEHLEICTENPGAVMEKVRNAGSIFLGNFTPEALGDYFAGPNHTIPTSGTSRFFSPLSVDDFIKKSSYLHYSEDALKEHSSKVVRFAESEGLYFHSESVKARFLKR
ncbi:MAG: histidinol dehydrogenase [Ruminococcaceae bacterium]|nr:histidinol dehydrogenase [Oscillospiraceae bacterium]